MNLAKNPLVVIDTNIWISGAFWEGNPRNIVHLVRTNTIIPVFSYETFDEFERVLNRTAMSLGKIDVANIAVKKAKEFAVFFEPRNHVSLSRDPHDDMFLDISVVSNALFLITGDDDLLLLKTIESTKIVTPKQFLKQPNLP